MKATSEMLPICRTNELDIQQPENIWLIESIWTACAVGVIGGAPKCCKSWFGLDMAVSVATGTPLLGRFAVRQPGPVLVFLAEDSRLKEIDLGQLRFNHENRYKSVPRI